MSYSYDLNGNLTSDGATSFVYDAENRLVSASGGKTASLAYDPLGRLWQTSGGGGGGTTRFLYDGDRLAIEYDGAGAILRSYIHGPGADEPLTWYEVVPGGWHRRFPKADHQGSIVAVAYGDGTPVGINTYDPWGIPGGTPIGRFGYTGQTWIPELGLWYYKARFYSPNLGRFLQTDPIGYDDQMNLYAYVGNDPVNRMDPTGLAGCGAAPNPTKCEDYQRAALQRVREVRSDLKHLRDQRSDNKPGIDARAKETQTALRTHFGSSTNAVARAVDSRLGQVETFLADPGTAAGGRFDYRAPTKDEIALGGALGIGIHNRGYRPNTVALNIQPGDAPTEILRTFIHEPLHVFGMNRPSIGEQLRGSSTALARVPGGTAAAVYNNPDNYGCFVYSLGC